MRATAGHYGAATLFVVLLTLGSIPTSAAAQPIERPTDCTEAMSGATIFIGHDCGEWASVMVVGNVVIRKPWSRANRANRGVRLRLRREGAGGAVVEPTRTPRPERTPEADCHPAYNGCLPIVEDLDCPEIDNRQLTVFDPANDPYGLDGSTTFENGITCDSD